MTIIKQTERSNWQTVKLILYHVVEDFQQKEDQMVIGRIGVQEPRCGKCLKHSTHSDMAQCGM